MAALIEQPRKSALHHPTPWHDLKAFALVAHYLQADLIRVLQVSYPLGQPLRLIAPSTQSLRKRLTPLTKYCVKSTINPTRSSVLAAVTTTAINRPRVSTNRCRLRPLTCLPPSKPTSVAWVAVLIL